MESRSRECRDRRMPMTFRGAFPLALALTIGLVTWGDRPAAPQSPERVMTRTGEARVPIYEDDLDQARRRALQQAQDSIIREQLQQLLAPEWYQLYEQDLGKRVLSRLDRYISAYRVRRLETSIDRTQYFASLEAQVDRVLLVNDLRDMALPILGERRTPVYLLYRADDPVLANPEGRAAALDAIGARLALLNIEAQKVIAVPASGAQAPAVLLDNPFINSAARQAWLATAAGGVPAVAYLRFARGVPTATPGALVLQLRFYLVRDGSSLADFSQESKGAVPAAITGAIVKQTIVPQLVQPVVNQIQPGSLGNPAYWGTQVSRLELRVFGLGSVYEEESFERDFFAAGSLFEKFGLSRLGPGWVSYEGEFRGDKARLERDLGRRPFGGFSVQKSFWNDGTLELFVGRRDPEKPNELKPYPAEGRPAATQALFEEMAKARPELLLPRQPAFAESEDNGRFDNANALLFNSPVYGYVDSRGDNDLFMGEALRPGESIAVEWYRLGRTNLSPALRVFDEAGVLQRTVYPTGTDSKFTVTVPAGHSRFFIEVADRFGYLIADAGGYLNYHYLLWVRRDAPDTPVPPLLPPPATAQAPAAAAPQAPAAAAPVTPQTAPPATTRPAAPAPRAPRR